MGNKLVTQTHPQLDYYLHDLPGTIVSDQSLNNSPLLKCIKCVHDEGPVVVKVYIKRAGNADLSKYVKQFTELRDTLGLRSCKNVYPSKKFIVTEKAGYIIRQYFAYNLHDRIGSRPFLSTIEKMWITFQLLKALTECNFYGISHGDIKSENVMLTSWNWVYLVDFATYKPTHIPADGPAEFSFFFDNSGRRTCYLAPERFISGKEIEYGELTHEMDIFSLGCVIAELFLDGVPRTIFTLAQLLSYRKGDYDPSQVIDRIDCEPARELIKQMISKDPTERFSSSYYLSEWENLGFPPYFEKLHPYISNLVPMTPDDKVLAMHNDFNDLVALMSPNTEQDIPIISNEEEIHVEQEISANIDQETSTAAVLSTSSLPDIEPLIINEPKVKVAVPADLPPQYINEYIKYASELPKDGSSLLCDTDNFLMNMETVQSTNSFPMHFKGREEGPQTSTEHGEDSACLEDTWSPSIFPSITSSTCKKEEISGMTLLLSILCTDLHRIISPTLRVKALKLFILMSQYLDDNCRLQRVVPYIISVLHDESAIVRSFGIEALTSVLDMVSSFPASDVHVFPEYIIPAIDHLSNDAEVIVKESFAKNLAKLAEIARRFLEASQLLLQQQTEQFSKVSFTNYDTALNEIHGIFSSIISQMFWKDCPCSVKTALLFDIARLAMFFGKKKTSDFLLPMIVTFLNENDWELRSAFFQHVVGLCEYVGGHSLESFVYPCILQALSDKEEFVIDKAINSLASMTSKDLFRKQTLYDIARKTSPLLLHPNIWIRHSVISAIAAISNRLDIVDRFTFLNDLVRPFLSGDIVDLTEENLLACVLPPLSRSLYETAVHACNKALQHWASSVHTKAKSRTSSGHIFVPHKPPHPYDPEDSFIGMFVGALESAGILPEQREPILMMSSYIKEVARHIVSTESRSNINVFVTDQIGVKEHTVQLPDEGDKRNHLEHIESSSEWYYLTHFMLSSPPSAFSSSVPSIDSGTQLQNFSLLRTLPELPDFGRLRKDSAGNTPLRGDALKAWKPNGTLVAHLIEHKQAVNQLCLSEDNQFFASCSNDGTVRLWDCQRLEKKVTNRARLVFNQQAEGGRLFSMCMLKHSHSIACGSENGKISVFRVDSDTSRKDVIDYKQCTEIERGFSVTGAITAMEHFNRSMESLLVCSTSAGNIHGFDLRMRTQAFVMDNTSKAGTITSMIIDPSRHWLLTGTIRGCYTCWDLRFNIPVSTWWQSGEDNQIYRLAHRKGTTFYSSVGNGMVNMWDINDQDLKSVWQVLEADQGQNASLLLPPIERRGTKPTPKTHANRLKNTPPQIHAHRALTVAPGLGYFLTGSADKCIRYWNVTNASRSFIVSGLPSNQTQPKYVSERHDVVEVCQEIPTSIPFTTFNSGGPALERSNFPCTHHHDTVLDVVLGEQPLSMIISASRDGVIKVWK